MRMRHGRPSAVPSPASRSGNRRRERRNGRPHAHRREARAAESRRGARMRTGARRGRPRADGGCVCRRAQGEGIRTTGTGPEARALPVRRARAAERTQTAELRRHTTSHQLQSSPRDTRARCSTGGGAWLRVTRSWHRWGPVFVTWGPSEIGVIYSHITSAPSREPPLPERRLQMSTPDDGDCTVGSTDDAEEGTEEAPPDDVPTHFLFSKSP